jgi:hypothetical protein
MGEYQHHSLQELGLPGKEMDLADAATLFYTGNYSKKQWNEMAVKVNRAVQPDKKRHTRGFVPRADAIKGHLKRMGALLDSEDLRLVQLKTVGSDDLVIDLTEEEAGDVDAAAGMA